MNLNNTGKLIAELRHEKKLTQKEVAEALGVCPKTVSKWETGRGFPDTSLIPELSNLLNIDISMLIDGEFSKIKLRACNIKNTRFYYCKNCGNIITGCNAEKILCCGRILDQQKPKHADDFHKISIQDMDDEYYISFDHPMTKEHFISFVSYVKFDRILTIKLYPEQNAELILPKMRGGKLFCFCNKDGLFELKI